MSENIYEWLHNYLDSLPPIDEPRRSIFDVADLSHRETANSNLLAYFLDPEEEHGLSKMFLTSLIEAFSSGSGIDWDVIDLQSSEYIVEREYSTRKGGRIDIVLTHNPSGNCMDLNSECINSNSNPEWAILIENKLHAPLGNDLKDYWCSVDAADKIGIVLSLHSHELDDSPFVNVLHKDFAYKIRTNLADYFLDFDGRHLVLLQEFLISLSNVGAGIEEDAMQEYEKMLVLNRKNRKEINRLVEEDRKLHRYVSSQVAAAFAEFKYDESPQTETSKGRQFFPGKDVSSRIEKMFNFWIEIDRFKNEGVLAGVFELHGDGTGYADLLRDRLAKEKVFIPKKVQPGTRGKAGGNYCHILNINIPVLQAMEFTSETVKDSVIKMLRENLFGENGPVYTAVRLLGDIALDKS